MTKSLLLIVYICNRITDSSKTGQIKEEMFQLQQKTKEHEAELLGDLDKANKRIHKSQESIQNRPTYKTMRYVYSLGR